MRYDIGVMFGGVFGYVKNWLYGRYEYILNQII